MLWMVFFFVMSVDTRNIDENRGDVKTHIDISDCGVPQISTRVGI